MYLEKMTDIKRKHILRMVMFAVIFFIAADTFCVQESFAAGLPAMLRKKRLRVLYVKNSNGKKIEYGRASGLKKKGYKIFQGACSDGEYGYHVLYNKKTDKCRLIKVDLKTKKVIKKSPAYKVYHGNDLAYDSKRDRIVMVHGDGDTKGLSIFDPDSLKRKKTVRLKFTKAFPGASTKVAKKIKGVTGIAYDKKKDRFVASVKSTFHYVILSAKFKPLKYVRTKTKGDLQKQGMDIWGSYILRTMNKYSGKKISNYIYIYNMKGKYKRRVRIMTGSEVEATYFLNDRMYAATYVEKGTKKKLKRYSYILKSRMTL